MSCPNQSTWISDASRGAGRYWMPWHKPREARPLEDYEGFLRWHGVVGREVGFTIGELVHHDHRPYHKRFEAPPRELWPNMVPTLATAIELRERMLGEGATGLRVAAAYRPKGGATSSAHKSNRALDLDLLTIDTDRDRTLARRFVEVAAGLYEDLVARRVKVGVGTYGPAGRVWSLRVHIDIDHVGGLRPVTWTHHKGRSHRPSAITLALRGGEET